MKGRDVDILGGGGGSKGRAPRIPQISGSEKSLAHTQKRIFARIVRANLMIPKRQMLP